MTEQANPQPGAVQEDPSSFEGAVSRLAQLESQGQEEPPKERDQPPAEEATEGQAEAEAESPASEEAEVVEQPEVEQTYKIVHQGQEVELTLAQAIEHAQQGYDYTRKNMALAEKARQADERLQRLAQIEQIAPHLQNNLAQVKALEAQLEPYQKVDWVQLAQDPQAYAQHQANYLNLQRAHQQAVGQFQQANAQVQQHLGAMKQQQLAQEDANLPSYIPEWKDPAKKEAGKAELLKYLQAQGISPQAADAKLDNALSVSIAYKAMKWDQLQKSKADTSKTLRKAPPVTVPGAKTTTAKADKVKAFEQKLRKSGSMDDAVEVLLNR